LRNYHASAIFSSWLNVISFCPAYHFSNGAVGGDAAADAELVFFPKFSSVIL